MKIWNVRAASSVTALAFASLFPCAVMAQSAGEAQAKNDALIVTGSLIRGSAEDAAAPIDVITADELLMQGAPSIMDLAKRLPTSAGVLGDASQFDTRSQFNQGSASINLRGLGPQRTLVLLNGKRIVASGAGNLPLVDVNLIPGSALGRIEVLKDGAAATYGSDAIAGVVNFITRQDQDGFLFGGDYQLIDRSDGDWNAAASWGGDLGLARVFVSAGFQHRSELRTTDRDWAIRPYDENPQGGFSGGGNPGNFDFNGSVGGFSFDADEGCEDLGGFRSLPGSSSDLCMTSYLGFTNLVEPEDRYQLFADVELPLGDAADLRLTALYGRTQTQLTTSPSYLPTIAASDSAAFGGTGLFTIPAYAPALIDYCGRYGAASGCDTDMAGLPQSPAFAYPVRFRPVLLGGNPLFDDDRGAAILPRDSDMYQFSGEVNAALSSSIDLSASVTYSEYDRYFEGGDSFVDLLQNSLAGFGGPNCAYANPEARAGLTYDELAALAGTNGCSYFNPFSTGVSSNGVTGQVNPDFAGLNNLFDMDLTPGAGLINDVTTIDDFYTIIQRTAETRQVVGDLILSGLSGVQLPGGEAGFAVGMQYRRDNYARTYSANNNLDAYPCAGSILSEGATCAVETGPIGFLGSNRNTDVNSDVWAVFAELQLPVADTFMAQLSARYENYGGGVGTTFDPQARIRWELADGIALRGGVGTTFRGPPPQNTEANLVILTFIGGAFRAVDILANQNLKPETATTYNAGLLVDRGPFKASLDWWRYDFSGAIEGEPINGMVAALFGAGGADNCGKPAYAGLEQRFTFSGDVCGSSNVQRMSTFAVNSADVTTSGIDFQASVDADVAGGMVQLGLSGTYVIEYEVGDLAVEGIAVQPSFDAVGKLNYQTTAYPIPQWKGQAFVQGVWGKSSLRIQANYIDGYTDQRGASVFGANSGVLAGASVGEGKNIGSFTTVDATYSVALHTGTRVSLSLANIFDVEPPFARLDQNFDPFTANPLGFTAKLGLAQAF